MDRRSLLLALSLSMTAAMAAPLPPAGVALDEVFRALRKEPLEPVHLEGARYDLVNDRFEPCGSRKEARQHGRFIRRIAPSEHGWSVQVTDTEGVLRMEGNSLDLDGTVFDGPFRFYDANGQLNAEGHFDRGRKAGTWSRYAPNGDRLTAKEYHAEDWDAMQVRLGLASLAALVGDNPASR